MYALPLADGSADVVLLHRFGDMIAIPRELKVLEIYSTG